MLEEEGKNMDKNKLRLEGLAEDDFGLLLWKLESLEKFYPCFNSLMKKE